MHNERRILLNTAVLSVFEGAGQLANFVLVISFARTFGAGTLGHYSVAMAVGAVAALLVNFGTVDLLIREFSRDARRVPGTLGVLLPVQALLACLTWLLACTVTLALVRDSAAIGLIMAVCGYQILMCLSSLLLASLQAKELMPWSAGGNLAHRLLILSIGLTVMRLGGSAADVCLAQIAGALSLIAFAWTQTARRFGKFSLRYDVAEAMVWMRAASPFFGVEALSILYARGALILLSALAVGSAVGLYAAADRFMIAVSLASIMFNSAVYPAMARVSHHSLLEAQALSARCVRMLLVLCVPIAILTSIYATDIITLCFGASYLGAARALQVLVWSLPLRGAQGLMASQLVAMDQQAGIARARAIGLGCFCVLAPLLIVNFGYVGAAWTVLVCDAVQFTLHWLLLRRNRAEPPLARAILIPGTAAALTAAAAVALEHQNPSMRLATIVLVLAAGMFALGAVRLHDLRFLRTLLRKA